MKEPDYLVTIIVVTYNSAKYVVETLESTLHQTYKNIELIVTDDDSADNTVVIAREWLANNHSRFQNSKIVTVEKNTGIPANCNRGLANSKGEWIKFIAGDDILLPHVITSYIEFVKKNDFQIVVSKMEVFDENGIIKSQTDNYNAMAKWFTAKSQVAQKKSYLRVPIMLNIPSIFYNRKVAENIGYYDEEIRLLEDQPFLIKCFLKGYRIGFNDVITVKYRKHNSGVMQASSRAFTNDLHRSFSKYIIPELKNYNVKDLIFKVYFKISFFLRKKQIDDNFLSKVFFRAINVMVKWS